MDSTFPLLKSEISSFYPSSAFVQPGLCRTWLEPKLWVFSRTGSNLTSTEITTGLKLVILLLVLVGGRLTGNVQFPFLHDQATTVEAVAWYRQNVGHCIRGRELYDGIKELQNTRIHMSHVMRKEDFCLCENKGADQLRSNCDADHTFVFATRIVQFLRLFFLNPKFQASSLLLRLYRPICVRPGLNPRRLVFSHRGSYRCVNFQIVIIHTLFLHAFSTATSLLWCETR